MSDKNSILKIDNDDQKKTVELLSPSQIALLLILSEGPANAYQILEILEKRGYENWVDMKRSITYKSLGFLEKEELIIGKREKREKNKINAKKVYSLTPKGNQILIEQVKQCITNPPSVKSMFDLGLSGLSLLTKAEAISILEQYMLGQGYASRFFEETLNDLDNVDKLVEIFPDKEVAGNTIQGHFKNKAILFVVRALFDRPYRIIKAQLEWLEEFIQSIKDDEGTFYFNERAKKNG